ncbi:GNAT family N-acetyltransferase [Streptomyces sp. NBC_00083]|uniref:GNAT family N-acetyltransferase n=1 Tax=Streptomyces sp. NBC_00083 TaxID=2975647 RepID=UPI00225A124F|nr:GNAT family N-acetyltransferase [Streptomyces sp. NBC_00083]MCX5382042.1 GNAT family N-acetyltransferase [Streptomyces sp. NBC_00083]
MSGLRGTGGGADAPRRIRVVRPGDLSAGELQVWRDVRSASPTPRNPFMEPEFTLAVGRVRASARVAVVHGEKEGGAPSGFFPFHKGALGQGRAIGFGVSDCQGIVGHPQPALTEGELLRACGVSSWAFDNLEAGQSLFVPTASAAYASFVIDVGDGYAAYETILRRQSPKFFRTTTAKERRLGRQAGEVRFVFDERDPAALARLMEWKSAQYRRTGRRDRFARPWISALVRQLAHTRAPGCSGVLSVLYAGDRPVAAHFGLRSRTVLACWFPAYDPEFAKYSPGLVLHLRMAEAAAAAGITVLDLGRGAAEYKDALKTGEVPVYEGAATRLGAGAALHWIAREPSRRAHGFVRNRPRLAEFAQRGLKRAGRLRGAGQ